MEQSNDKDEAIQLLERLQEEFSRLKEDIDQSYYRVPKQEFENITVKKIAADVNEQLNKKINTIRYWIGAVILTLSFFGFSQWTSLTDSIKKDLQSDFNKLNLEFTSSIDRKLDARVKEIETRFKSRLESIVNDQAKLNQSQKEDLARVVKNIKASNDTATTKLERQLKIVEAELKSGQKILLKTELGAIRNEVRASDLKTKYAEALDKLNPVLDKALKLGDTELTQEFLDELFRWTFQSTSYEDMDKLRVKFESDHQFTATTWANIAIAGMFLYVETASPIYKERALSAYNHSSQRSPGYGLPHAVRLIMHMIDVERAIDEADKAREIVAAEKLINTVVTGTVPLTAYEAYDYLLTLENDKDVGIHITMLFNNFPTAMERMGKKYDTYLNR